MSEPTDQLDIVLCPGQGAQHVGMGQAWADAHPQAARVFAEADDVLGLPLSKLCFEGPEDELNRTDIAQAAIYVTSAACFKALQATGRVNDIAAAAGLSLGEFTALHLAGALDFASGLKLVRLRGQAMQAAAEASDGGMVALIGATPEQAADLCDTTLADAGDGQVLVPANFNAPGQIVISGSAHACERAVAIADTQGLRAKALTVAGAFHSPLMAPAAEKLAAALRQTTWRQPRVPVVSNVTARPHAMDDLESVKSLLVRQLTEPVRWSDSMTWMTAHTQGRYIELAPNKVLAGLMKRIDRAVKVINFANPE